MFKLISKQHGAYYCRTREQAEALKAVRKTHNETGYCIVELKPRSAEQMADDHNAAF